jgi:hypothetical protein
MVIEEKQRNQIHPSERGAELLAVQSKLKGKVDWTKPTWPKQSPPLIGK